MAPKTLLAKLGGPEALEAAVDILYDKLLADDDLKRFFDGISMQALRRHQVKFMSAAFTEIPEGYDVAGVLLKGHARLFDMDLNEEHFDLVASHFVATLTQLGVTQDLIDEAVAIVGSLRPIFEQGAAEALSRKEQQENSQSGLLTN